MTMTPIGEPGAGEFDAHFESYVARVRGNDVMNVLGAQVGVLRRELEALPEKRAGFRYAEGKWSVREVVGHCSDAERVFAYRALALARGERAPLPAFDEGEYARVAGHDAIPLGELVGEFASVRSATLQLLRHLEPEAWRRGGVASGAPITVRALAFIMAGHVAHHVAILHERYGVGA